MVPFASTVSVAVSPEAIVRLSGSLVIVGATAGCGAGGSAGGGVEGGGSGGATAIVAVTESMLAVASAMRTQ